MTHRIRGGFSEYPQALCGVTEPDFLVDHDEAVTCSRCRVRVFVRLIQEHDRRGRAAERCRLEAAWAALDAAA